MDNNIKWSEEDTTFHLTGSKSYFYCKCGCNVFRENSTKNKAKCNGCNTIFDTYKGGKSAK